jgi:hypothetical protein
MKQMQATGQKEVQRLLSRAEQVLPLIHRVMAQSRARVLESRKVASEEKVLSLHEPHTRIPASFHVTKAERWWSLADKWSSMKWREGSSRAMMCLAMETLIGDREYLPSVTISSSLDTLKFCTVHEHSNTCPVLVFFLQHNRWLQV